MPFKAFSRPRFRQMLGHERGKPLGSATAEPSPESVAPEPMAPDIAVPESSSGSGKLETGPFDATKDTSPLLVSKVVPETSPLILFDRDFQATSSPQGIQLHIVCKVM